MTIESFEGIDARTKFSSAPPFRSENDVYAYFDSVNLKDILGRDEEFNQTELADWADIVIENLWNFECVIPENELGNLLEEIITTAVTVFKNATPIRDAFDVDDGNEVCIAYSFFPENCAHDDYGILLLLDTWTGYDGSPLFKGHSISVVQAGSLDQAIRTGNMGEEYFWINLRFGPHRGGADEIIDYVCDITKRMFELEF